MKNKIYLVIPCYNEEEVIRETAKRTSDILKDLILKKYISSDSRICFVNDGSSDNTWNIITELCHNGDIFFGINLSRNFGHQNALMAGLDFVKDKCDAAITLDADLQQDVNSIEEFIRKYYDGNEIVYGVRTSRSTDSLMKKITAIGFYKFMKLFGCNVLPNHADYRLMSATAIKALMGYKEVNLFLRGIIPFLGYKSDIVQFEVFERFAGASKYSVKKMIGFALNGITSLTIKPVRIITLMGLIIFFASIIMAIYFLIIKMQGITVPGWTTIVMSIWFIGGIQLLSIGIIGEYIGKIYLETKERPRYIIEKVIKQD